jgi:glycosyltransferase involved in cell wall biosynthesis
MKDVTILIPAYNEEKHIEQAILSSVSQAEFVIVSDNCSTDKTPEICKKLAKEYKNLIFYEQKENIGSIRNFSFLLNKVETTYTLHIGAHDFISENYILNLKKALEENSSAR